MKSNRATGSVPQPAGQPAKVFTVADANRALVLVRRVVQDIVSSYGELLKLRDERAGLGTSKSGEPRIPGIQQRSEALVAKLSALQDELTDVGCLLKDWTIGLVDFPAQHAGRTVYLCWKLGEPEIGHWHEPDSGFSGRQKIGPGF